MNEFFGHDQANVQTDDETVSRAPNAATSSDPFGLGMYTGQAIQTSEPKEPSQPNHTEPARPDGRVETRWQTQLGEPVVGRPVAHEDRLIVTGRSGRIYALDVTDGNERWRSASRIATTRPTADAGLAFVGNEDGLLQAFDTMDGSTRWTTEIDGAIETAPAVQDNYVYACTDRRAVYVIDANCGGRRIAFGHGSRAICSLAVDQETVHLGSAGGGLQARCTTDGRERWVCVPDQAIAADPVATNERVYVATVDGEDVLAIDRVTGAVRQRFGVGSAVWSRPVVTDDIIVVTSQEGIVTTFDRDAGTRRWQVELCGSAWGGPAIDGGRIYVADDVGRTYGIDASDGELQWRFDADAAITTTPTLVDDTVVIVTEPGTVYALAETGI